MVKKILLAITCGIVAVSMCACASSSAILEQAQEIVADNVSEVQNYVPEELINLITPGQQSQVAEAEEPTVSPEAELEAQVAEEPAAEVEPAEAAEEEATEAAEPATEAAVEEETAAAEPVTEAAAEEKTAAAEPATEAAVEEETAAAEPATEAAVEEETAAAEPATEAAVEEETAAAEPATDAAEEVTEAAQSETKVMLNDTEETEAAEEATEAAQSETKVMLNDTEETTAAEEETEAAGKSELAAAEEETTVAADEEETTAATEEETTVAAAAEEETTAPAVIASEEKETAEDVKEVVIKMDKDAATVDGEKVTTSSSDEVYISDDIVYYQDKDKYISGNAYGAGDAEDRHTAAEAKENKVLNITKAGTYRLQGSWLGQINVDLGNSARNDENAKVVLVLDDASVSCTVAPAVVIKNAYECDAKNFAEAYAADEYVEEMTGASDQAKEDAKDDADQKAEEETTAAADEEETFYSSGDMEEFSDEEMAELFNFLFGMAMQESASEQGSNQNGSQDEDVSDFYSSIFGGNSSYDYFDGAFDDYLNGETVEEVAVKEEAPDIDTKDAGIVIRIAKDSENMINGAYVAPIYKDSKDRELLVEEEGAICSYVTLNIEAEAETGSLSVIGEKVGISSKHHLTINGGDLNILSSKEGLYASEVGVSVVAINGGTIHIYGGYNGEGNPVFSYGWFIVNDGNLIAVTNAKEPEMDVATTKTIINGGTVVLAGEDKADLACSESKAVTINLQFDEAQNTADGLVIKDQKGKTVFELSAEDDEMLSSLDSEYRNLSISCPEFKEGETYFISIGGKTLVNEGIAVEEDADADTSEDEEAAEDIDKLEEAVNEELDKLSEYADLFEYFGISQSELAEYFAGKLSGTLSSDDQKTEEETKPAFPGFGKDDQKTEEETKPAFPGFDKDDQKTEEETKPAFPGFGKDDQKTEEETKPAFPGFGKDDQKTEEETKPAFPGFNKDDQKAEEETEEDNNPEEFTLSDTVTTFLGVKVLKDDKEDTKEETEEETTEPETKEDAEEETKEAVTEEETTEAAEPETTEEAQEETESAALDERTGGSGSFQPFGAPNKTGQSSPRGQVKVSTSNETPDGFDEYAEMTAFYNLIRAGR